MIWHIEKDEPAPSDIDLLLVNEMGAFYVGYRDEFGFYQSHSTLLDEILDVAYWLYLADLPPFPFRRTLMNYEFVNKLGIQGLL